MKKLYMIVDKKNNELPLCVGTLKEVSTYSGKSENAIISAIYHAEKRGHNCQYKCVEIDDEE